MELPQFESKAEQMNSNHQFLKTNSIRTGQNLVKTQLCVLVTIPHHAGRKRMHLELKDTVTKLMTGDLKKKLIDGVWSSLGALYNTATGSFKELLFLFPF